MTSITLYKKLEQVVNRLYQQLKLDKQEKTKGRKLALSIIKIISLSVFKQFNGIPTKKSIFNIFEPKCSYKTLVVNMNRFARQALLILAMMMKINNRNSHIIKHTDSTELPVCLNKNANRHKTMKRFSSWGKNGKGWFFGLKMHITTSLDRKLLSVKFSPGNTSDSKMFMELNKDISGIFVADGAYISDKLAKEVHDLGKGFLFAKPRKNMKKIITDFQFHLYNTRMLIEINFRNLKAFYGLITSLPKSVNGYFANYIYSLLAYQFA
ncbi:MAG: hypothetical protein A3C50_03140 [Candidatus Staskawiczbacteria bacterium RIFCSPHIGHO2_02_FULL_43_16]|nr:MAG: hypothetical protein A3C50_03140 [Candidatus Staskawiczbacteria bacterium RIFCSPHIGHO2_02_FULL_43_16]